MEEKKSSNSAIPGLSVMLCIIVAVGSIFIGVMALANENDFTAAGVCLIAAALASGLLANAVWRN